MGGSEREKKVLLMSWALEEAELRGRVSEPSVGLRISELGTTHRDSKHGPGWVKVMSSLRTHVLYLRIHVAMEIHSWIHGLELRGEVWEGNVNMGAIGIEMGKISSVKIRK